MPKNPSFRLFPALRLLSVPDRVIRTIDDASKYVRTRNQIQPDASDQNVLRLLDQAVTPEDCREATIAFRAWAHERALFVRDE
jgi:hypothetical protein